MWIWKPRTSTRLTAAEKSAKTALSRRLSGRRESVRRERSAAAVSSRRKSGTGSRRIYTLSVHAPARSSKESSAGLTVWESEELCIAKDLHEKIRVSITAVYHRLDVRAQDFSCPRLTKAHFFSMIPVLSQRWGWQPGATHKCIKKWARGFAPTRVEPRKATFVP